MFAAKSQGNSGVWWTAVIQVGVAIKIQTCILEVIGSNPDSGGKVKLISILEKCI
jgi:hypothetical protein